MNRCLRAGGLGQSNREIPSPRGWNKTTPRAQLAGSLSLSLAFRVRSSGLPAAAIPLEPCQDLRSAEQ